MIIKKEYKSKNAISYTLTDNIEKIDSGVLENGTSFINVYKRDRKKDDDFETILIESVNIYVCNDEGKTLSIFRSNR